MLIGAIIAGLVFAGMWQFPEGQTKDFYFWFFLVGSVMYFLTYTVFATPFVALGYEMTPDYHERTRLHAFANSFGQLAWLGAPWIWAIMSSYASKIEGASVLGLWFGGAILVLGMIPAICCRERVADLAPAETTAGVSGVAKNLGDFFKSLITSLKCKPFVKLCLATFLVFNGFQLGITFALYVMIYYLSLIHI